MIPVNEPLLDGNEKLYLAKCIDDKWISSEGPFVTQFEEMVSAYLGVKHGVAVSNGTAALEVAVGAIGLRPGDEVIMPSFTIISCPLAVTRYGGVPVLVDCEEDTWTMDVGAVASKVTTRTRAIMAVHMYGHPVDMDPLLDLAKTKGLRVIEDAAEVVGAEYKGRRCGGIGHIAAMSFYANKIVTTGEGGMVVTDDDLLAERARSIRNLCFVKEKRFIHYELGGNFRMTNLQAAVGVAQMEQVDRFVRLKRENAHYYLKLLRANAAIQLPVEREWAKNVYWMFGIVLKRSSGMNALQLAHRLVEWGVQTRPFFYPIHLQPVYNKMGFFRDQHFPVSETIAELGLYLPSGVALTASQVETVAGALNEILPSSS